MTEKTKEMIDKSVEKVGISKIKYTFQRALEDSYALMRKLQKSGKDLMNVPSHIESQKEILEYLEYLLSKERDEKLSKLLSERKICNFSEFSKFF